MTVLLVYAGPNGSGKSSLRDHAPHPDRVDLVIDPGQIARRINPADPMAASGAAGREALELFDLALSSGCSMSLETTLSGRSVLRRLAAARGSGFRVELRFVALETVELNIQRVRARAARGGHFIPPEVVRRRYASGMANLLPAIRLVDAAALVDNSGEMHRLVVSLRHGRVERMVFPLSGWMKAAIPGLASTWSLDGAV